MPSRSLRDWQTVRLSKLQAIETQCANCSTPMAPNPALLDQNCRAYVMLLSAHFQGFCRDLYTECVQIVTSFLPASLERMIQTQFTAGQQLDRSNPHIKTLREDFDRFGFDLNAILIGNPTNAMRISKLGELNAWRNHAAHDKNSAPASGPLTMIGLQAWRKSCDELAVELDGIMYNHLRTTLGVPPW